MHRVAISNDGFEAVGKLIASTRPIRNVLPESQGGQVITGQHHYFGEIHTQLDYPWIDTDTDLVTITIGGNDVGFSDVLINCATSSCYTLQRETELRQRIDNLKADLIKVYQAIRSKAPNARILVVGYPQLFPESAAEQGCTKLTPWAGEMGFLRGLTSYLDDTIHRATLDADADIEFEDVRDEFQGHEVCGSKGEWINGAAGTIKLGKNGGVKGKIRFDDESFHPNVLGQIGGYGIAVVSHLATS